MIGAVSFRAPKKLVEMATLAVPVAIPFPEIWLIDDRKKLGSAKTEYSRNIDLFEPTENPLGNANARVFPIC